MTRSTTPTLQVQRQAIDAIRSLGPLGRKALPRRDREAGEQGPGGPHRRRRDDREPRPGRRRGRPGARLLARRPGRRSSRRSPPRRSGTWESRPSRRSAGWPRSWATEHRRGPRARRPSALGSLELDAEAIRPHLARALRDDNAEVRRAAPRAIQRLGPQGAIFVPDIILLAEGKENLRIGPAAAPPVRADGARTSGSLPELVKQLEHDKEPVRLLAIKFLGLAGRGPRTRSPPWSGCARTPAPRSASRHRPRANRSAAMPLRARGRTAKPRRRPRSRSPAVAVPSAMDSLHLAGTNPSPAAGPRA